MEKLKPNFSSLLLDLLGSSSQSVTSHAEEIGLQCVFIDRVFSDFHIFALYPKRRALLQQIHDVHDFIRTDGTNRKVQVRHILFSLSIKLLAFADQQAFQNLREVSSATTRPKALQSPRPLKTENEKSALKQKMRSFPVSGTAGYGGNTDTCNICSQKSSAEEKLKPTLLPAVPVIPVRDSSNERIKYSASSGKT